MKSKRLFVKFRPLNIATLSTLINKTIKFSTVYEFNDPNELGYLSSGDYAAIGNTAEFDSIIQSKLSDFDFRKTVIDHSYCTGYSQEYIDKLTDYLKHYPSQPLDERLKDMIMEQIAFYSVGILSLSNVDVFDSSTDAAQLMFAHYGDNFKGVALIYECENANELCQVYYPHPVDDYESESNKIGAMLRKSNKTPARGGEILRVTRWAERKFNKNDMSDFCKKSKSWEYEHEYRMFQAPGIRLANGLLKLSAILYAPRLEKQHIETLKSIIENQYKEDNVKLLRIRLSHSRYSFVYDDAEKKEYNKSVIDWFKNL